MKNTTSTSRRKTQELRTAILDSTRWNQFTYRDDDIVVVSWGKSGSTWTYEIVRQLVASAPAGAAVASWPEFRLFPLEESLAQLEAQTHRRFIKTHLPLYALHFSDRAKYIYVGRDVRDIVWSAYNHQAGFTQQALDAFNDLPDLDGRPVTHPPCDVHEYYLRFLKTGEMPGFPLSPLWEHIHSWWNVRHLPNVLFVHFNNLKVNMPAEICRIAEFLDIRIDETKWPLILEHCSFDYMRTEAAKLELLSNVFSDGGRTFFHRGTNGRWKDTLTEEEIAECDLVAAQKLAADCRHWLRTGELPRLY